MAAERINPAQQAAKREEPRRQIEDTDTEDISLGMVVAGPDEVFATARALGYGVNAAQKLSAIAKSGGMSKAGPALVDEAKLLFKPTGRSLEQAYREVTRATKKLSKSLSERLPRRPAASSREYEWRIDELPEALTAPSQKEVMREAALAKKPATERALAERAEKAAEKLAAREGEKAALTKTLKMRSTKGDVLNKHNLPLVEEIEPNYYRGHKPPPFDEVEIARGTKSPLAFKEMKRRHHPATRREIHGAKTEPKHDFNPNDELRPLPPDNSKSLTFKR